MNEYDAQLPEMKIEINEMTQNIIIDIPHFREQKRAVKPTYSYVNCSELSFKFVIQLSLVLHAIIGCFPSSGNRVFYHNCPHQSCRIIYIHHTSPWCPPWNSTVCSRQLGFSRQLPAPSEAAHHDNLTSLSCSQKAPRYSRRTDPRWIKMILPYQVNPSCTLW